MVRQAAVLALALLSGCACKGIKPPPADLTSEFQPTDIPHFVDHSTDPRCPIGYFCLTEPNMRKAMLHTHDVYTWGATPRAYLRGTP